MIALTLVEIAEAIDGNLHVAAAADGAARADGSTVITGAVQTDSRLVEPGGVFVALRGETTDGHLFAPQAVSAGAALVIAERPLDLPVAQVVVPNSLLALAALARTVVARVREQGDLTVVGITGSNGKTTTKNLLAAVLATSGPTVAPTGSFNNQVGAPLSMLRIDLATRFLVVEMGASAVGDIARLVGIVMPDISVVLKVGMAHAGGFGGIEATQRAKAEIVTGLPADAVAVLNIDDPRVVAMASQTAARVRWFGLSAGADVRADEVDTDLRGTSFTLLTGGDSRRVAMRILGEHHVMNALAAIAVALEVGIEADVAATAVERVARAERWRMEVLEPAPGVTVINDAYNASPDSMAAALKTLAQLTRGRGRSIAVLGEMSELGDSARDEHDFLGRLAVRLNISQLVVVGHGARHINTAAGLEGSWDGESVLVDTADEAFDLLDGRLREGDVVLVKSSNSAGLRFLGDRLGGVTA